MAQTLLTALIVACSAAYVLWALLLPAAARRRIASALLRLPGPVWLTQRLQAPAKVPSGCGCDGCGNRPAQTAPQPVHWAPRRKR
jgi:hypothetical protein